MITANQLRAARALLNIDQRQTADLADLSVPTIQRMEASDGVIRANVDSLMKLVSALENAGIELINPGAPSASGGRGVRLRDHVAKSEEPTFRQKAGFAANRRADAIEHDPETCVAVFRKACPGLDPRDHAQTTRTAASNRAPLLSTRCSSARRPCSMAVGVGGQPGM